MTIDKIRDEMAANHDHQGIQMVGQYMTARLTQDAGLTINDTKTLKGAFEAIHSYASKHKTGNFAFVPPETAYQIVDEYFGIPHTDQPLPAAALSEPAKPQALAVLPKADDALDLDKLLEGL